MPEYLSPELEKEVARVTEQDAVITHFMCNKRIVAPVDLNKPGLVILDSATADGLFLREIQPLLTEPYTLLGCDFVHQHFAIVGGAQKATPRQIVGHLCQLVKPGGWIQLGEQDVRGPVSGGPALDDTLTAIRSWMVTAGAGPGATFANDMAGWLREEGFEGVQEVPVHISMGPSSKDAEWGHRSAQVLVAAATGITGACKMMNVDVVDSVLDKLPERAAEEFTKEGGTYGINIAIGRKPTA
ncbi:hypothetical protein LA080_011604 [Diaporthe eres]|uniref:Methyltransferase n=1 Tax=Diaporthe vaccinii TaxID=105482 RepID=A0ABR4EA95_9PEZI|nr:hypothetical protein LA080_011604 [Diaporthe eres]